MKHVLYLALFLGLSACMSEEGNLLNDESEFPLSSPKGVVLAKNMEQLVTLITDNEGLPKDADIAIVSLEYLETDLQTVAFLQWQDEKGVVEGMALKMESSMVGNPNNVGTTTWKISCKGDCGCREMGSINPDGTVTVECSCTTCTMHITQ